MEINFSREWEFIPEWNGNKEDKEPIKVLCRYLSTEEKNSCYVKDYAVIDEKQRITVNTKDESLFKFAVKKICNFKSQGKDITTPEALLKEPGTSGLYQEIVTAIWNKEADVLKELKN